MRSRLCFIYDIFHRSVSETHGIKAALSAEAKAIRNLLAGKDCFNIALCIEGTKLSSENLAEKIKDVSVSGKRELYN